MSGDDRTWTCDRCGFEFPSTRKTRGGVLPNRCPDCKKAARQPTQPGATARSNNELAYLFARECTELRCAMQEALRAITTGHYLEARIALESVIGPPTF